MDTTPRTIRPTKRTTAPKRHRKRLGAAAATTALVGSLVGGFLPGLPSPAAGADPVGGDELFVRQAYVDVVRDADPDPAAVQAAIDSLNGGQSQASWLWNLLMSAEGRGAFVDSEFARLLDRDADPAGRAFYVDKLARGATRANLRAFMIGSNEYFNLKGGTNDAFVDAAYLDLLGRAADGPGKAFWVQRLEDGYSRTRMANAFQAGSEGRRFRVQAIFFVYLNRAPDPAGLSYWMGRLADGTSEERMIATISGGSEYVRIATTVPDAEEVVLLTDANELINRTPGNDDVVTPITGIHSQTSIVGIDIRPATGVLYALGSDGQLYTIERARGTADRVGEPIPDFDASAGVGFDFNPVADAIRVVTADKNYRLNANTGVVVGEGPPESGMPGPITYAPGDPNEGETPEASGAGYTNSQRGLPLPETTALYDIDSNTDALVRQNPANAGTLATVGDLLLHASNVNGFDVSPDAGQNAYAVLTTENGQGLYRVDLTTGEPKLLDDLASTEATITGLAVVGSEAVVPTETLMGLSADGLAITTFPSTDPSSGTTQVLAGQNVGTNLVGMDVRPSTGVLYALGSDGQLYTVDLSVPGVATATPANPIVPPIGQGEIDFTQGVGFDFNPAADAIRIVVGDQNFRVLTNGVVVGEGPPNTGLPGSIQYVAGDPGAGTTPDVTGAAYTNSYRSETLPTATALFDIETERDVLVRQNPANAGDLTTVGDLGVDATGVDGFDVSGGPGQTAYAVMTVADTPTLFRIDLATGEAIAVAELPAGLSGLAVQ